MPRSNYPHGFANGVSIQNIPFNVVVNPDADTFWVDSNSGSNGNEGTNIAPFATIDYAIGQCTANKGDVIYVAAGHLETIVSATGLVADVAGVSIIGLGYQSIRPIIDFSTSTAASVVVTAADVVIKNILFACDIASQVTMIDCGKRTIIDNCSFIERTETGLTMVNVNGGGTGLCDGVIIKDCIFYAPTAENYSAAIELGEVADSVNIIGCTVWGDFDDACIHNPTGKVLTNLNIDECTLTNLQTGIEAIELVSACTGVARNLMMYTDTYATTIDPGALACFECYSVSSADKNARLNPVVET